MVNAAVPVLVLGDVDVSPTFSFSFNRYFSVRVSFPLFGYHGI